MEEYRKYNNNFTLIKYWIAFSPLYKRKIFKNEEVKNVFKSLVFDICKESNIKMLSISFLNDYCVILRVECPAEISSHEIAARIKTRTSPAIKKIIGSNRGGLWTRHYLISTEEQLKSEELQEFLSMQKSSPRD